MPKQNALRAECPTKVNMLIKGMCLVLGFLDGLDLFFMSTGTYLTEVWHLWSKSSWQCMEWLPLLSFCLWPNRTWIWMFSLKCNSWVTVIWMYSKNRNTMLQCSDFCSYILRSWQKLLHGRQDSCADCIEPWIEMYRLSMLCLFWCWWEWLDTGGRREDSRLTNVYIYHYCLRVDYIDVSCQAMETTKALCPSPARSFGRSVEICELAWTHRIGGGLWISRILPCASDSKEMQFQVILV